MKKDKLFCKRKFFYKRGNASWCVNVVSRQLMFVHLNGNVCIQKKNVKQLRKFIKALKKGLRRLKRG